MIKKYKPITPGLRHRIAIKDPAIQPLKDKHLVKGPKYLRKGENKTGGRNHSGKITMRFRGGGPKKLIRKIDRKYRYGLYTKNYIHAIIYCPNFSANIALCSPDSSFFSTSFFFRVATKGIKVGQTFIGPYIKEKIPKDGDVRFIKEIPEGRAIHNVEIKPGQGAVYSRSAGSFATILSHSSHLHQSLLILPSKQTIVVNNNCIATVGKVGNDAHIFEKYGKAGVSR